MSKTGFRSKPADVEERAAIAALRAGDMAGLEVLVQRHQAEVLQAVGRLPVKQRAVGVLRYYLDLDERSIAQLVGVPVGTVKWRLFAARRRLKGELAPDTSVVAHACSREVP